MKKIKTIAETVAIIAILALWVFSEINYTKINYNQHENVPVIKNGDPVKESTRDNSFDSGLPGLPNQGFMVISY